MREKRVFNDRVLLAIHRALPDTLVQDREIQAMQWHGWIHVQPDEHVPRVEIN